MLSLDRPAVYLSYIYAVYLQSHGLQYIFLVHFLTISLHVKRLWVQAIRAATSHVSTSHPAYHEGINSRDEGNWKLLSLKSRHVGLQIHDHVQNSRNCSRPLYCIAPSKHYTLYFQQTLVRPFQDWACWVSIMRALARMQLPGWLGDTSCLGVRKLAADALLRCTEMLLCWCFR